MPHVSASQVVDTVLRSRVAKASEADTSKQLMALGVPAADVRSVIECVEQGFKAGTVAVITGGASSAGLPSGENPVFDAAFRRGKSAMRFTTPWWVLVRLVGPWLLLALLIGVIVYFAVA